MAEDIFDIDCEPEHFSGDAKILIIACGALAREILHLIDVNGLSHIALTCVPAKYHNRPEKITPAVREKIRKYGDRYDKIYAGFADCGTGGELDRLLEEEGIERLLGAHCYAFYAGQEEFAKLSEDELGTFYLTDYLVRHFDVLMKKGMSLDNSIVREELFRHYKRVVYLAQSDDAELDALALSAANYLGLDYLRVASGYGELQSFIEDMR